MNQSRPSNTTQATLPLTHLQVNRKIDLIVIHCTASRCTSDLTPTALEREHCTQKMSQCGYHFYIRKNGIIHPMRPLSIIGAHVKGHNSNSIGIAYEGGLNARGIPTDTRTPEQRSALRALLHDLRSNFPNARILGHRDLSPDLNNNGIIESCEYIKQCPCFDAIPEYADI